MFNCDLLCVWPDTIDFPLFRKFLKEERERFQKVIIVWSKTNWEYPLVKEKVAKALKGDDITFLECDPVESGKDWRDVATNTGLKESTAEWVWFTEQDFFIYKPEKFWEGIKDCIETGADAIGYYQNNERLHPCCIFVKKFILDNFTSKYFGVIPSGDHFKRLEKELSKEEEVSLWRIREEARFDWFYHMNGLTHNLFLVMRGEKPVYKPEEFYEYLKKCEECEPKL